MPLSGRHYCRSRRLLCDEYIRKKISAFWPYPYALMDVWNAYDETLYAMKIVQWQPLAQLTDSPASRLHMCTEPDALQTSSTVKNKLFYKIFVFKHALCTGRCKRECIQNTILLYYEYVYSYFYLCVCVCVCTPRCACDLFSSQCHASGPA